MKFLTWILVVAALVTAYAVFLRPWLREQSWAQGYFRFVDPIELALWKKSETILFARVQIVLGLTITALTSAGAIDITPLMPLVPDAWEPVVLFAWNLLPLTLTVLGWISEKLRKDTTKPLELVAVSEAEKEKPAVAEAIATAEVAKIEAVAAVEVAKVEGA